MIMAVYNMLTVFLVVSMLHIVVGYTVIGWPTISLPGPGNGVLIGATNLYEEPDFLGVSKPIDSFLGVPFAQPPVGELRFADPLPYEIQGEYNASYDRPECMQPTLPDGGNPDPLVPRRVIGEDCLFLSIFTPSPTPTTPTPVMVWIHGGDYKFGGGSENMYEPFPLIAVSDIIVVNVNYRMGVFGFLTTGDDVALGNYGLMDQLLALQWVQDNIAAFGGDPQRVTIAGQSSGGSSVSQHMLSPISRGLFQQAIMQSGNAACPWSWTTMERASTAYRVLAEDTGCPTGDSQQMIDCMRAVDADELQHQQNQFHQASNGSLTDPVVDGRFLPYSPVEMIKRNQFAVVPTLMGTNEDEAAAQMLWLDRPDSIFERPTLNISAFRSLLPSYTYVSTPDELAAVEQHYIDWTVADDPSGDQLEGFIRLQSDQDFACPTEFYARALESAGAEIYRYQMTHDPAWSIFLGIPKWTGAAHAEDLQFVFAWGLNPTLKDIVGQTDEEKAMSVEWMRYWTNFVISGNPNQPLTSSTYPDWPRYTMPEQEYKELSLNMTNGRAMRAADCAFWLNYMPDLHFTTAPADELYEDWQEQYELWRDVDMPSWTEEFDKYKDENTCSNQTP